MKQVVCGLERQDGCEVLYRSGPFSYRLIPDFPKYPNPDWIFSEVGAGWIDRNDNVYVMVRDRNRVLKLDNDGNFLGEFDTGMRAPHFACMTPNDTVLITDVRDHCVEELSLQGEHIRTLGNKGVPSDTGRDLLHWKRERRYGRIIPTELESYFTSVKWEFRDNCGCIIRRGAPFHSPTCCVCGSDGSIYAGDGYGNCAVHCFDRDGNLLRSFGEPASTPDGGVVPGPGKFFVVHGIALDKQGRIWANDREDNAVNVFNPDGSVAAYLTGNLGQPSDLWYDGQYMYCAGRAGYLTIFNDDFDIVAQLGFFNSTLMAHAICGNSRGDLYIFPTKCNPDHQVIKLERLR